MKRLRERLTDACVILAVTLAILAGLELAARVASKLRSLGEPAIEPTLLKRDWGRQYALDQRGVGWQYVPYVEYREKPYRSPTINVDQHGRRVVPGNCERPEAFTIWAFGGSTMFGFGAPDAFTIPAHLAQILDRAGRCARVVNFGSSTWQSTQSLIELVKHLRTQAPPDVVIFYDGINEVASILDGAGPGGIWSNPYRRLAQALEEPGLLEGAARGSVLLRIISNRVIQVDRRVGDRHRERIRADLPRLAKQMTEVYGANLRMVEALAKQYGFEPYFFLQPFPVLSGKALTPEERASFEIVSAEWIDGLPLMRSLYGALASEPSLLSHPRYFDLSKIFDGMTEELFLEETHLLPEGNRIVAERIAQHLLGTAPTQGVAVR